MAWSKRCSQDECPTDSELPSEPLTMLSVAYNDRLSWVLALAVGAEHSCSVHEDGRTGAKSESQSEQMNTNPSPFRS